MDTDTPPTPGAPQSAPTLSELTPALLASVPNLLDDLEKELIDVSADYAEFVNERRDVVQFAAEQAIEMLVSITQQILADRSQPAALGPDIDPTVFEEIGRMQWREGTPVGTLLSAYQVGARLVWRHMSQRAVAEGLAPEALAALAESVFCFVDQLSSSSAAGYLAEQSEAAAARERWRDELVDLLLSDRSDSSTVRAAALRAGWPLPNSAAVILVEPHNEVGRAMVSRLDPDCLPVRSAGLLGAIVPDASAPGRRARLATGLRGSSAVIGHTVSLDQLGASARVAEVAARLQQAGVLSQDPVFVDEHLDAIIVHREPKLLEALQSQCLAPLEQAAPASREALRETLRAWLRCMGDRREIAAELHIHPQTVRYRVARLRELFGESLDSPEVRLQLTLALAWNR
jgi:hypothetical protein